MLSLLYTATARAISYEKTSPLHTHSHPQFSPPIMTTGTDSASREVKQEERVPSSGGDISGSFNTQQMSGPQASHASAASTAGRLDRMEEQLNRFMENILKWQQQMMQQPPLRAEYSRAPATTHTQLFGLSAHPSSPSPGDYSAADSLPPPQRIQPAHRKSFGRPSTPNSYIPLTPAPQQHPAAAGQPAQSRLDQEAEDDVGELSEVSDDDEPLPPRDTHMEAIRKAVTHAVKKFHGQRAKDTYTVIDWVEQVETEFTIHMGERKRGRLDIVRSLLAGPALKWMNRTVREMNDQVKKGLRTERAEWHLVRREFIAAHLGSSTAQTFKAELRALRLGSSTCKSPSELNAQFDQLAELAYPDRRGEGALEGVLGEEYANIVAQSDMELYTSIESNLGPQTIDEWKVALARYWTARQNVAIKKKLLKTPAAQPFRGKSWASKSSGLNRSSATSQSTLAAVQTEDGERQEGEPEAAESEDSQQQQQQLNAAGGRSSQRGGRASRGGGGQRGRGGGAERAPQGEVERQAALQNRRCFQCGEKGHIKNECPNPTYQQLKEQAGQQ